ncbi:HlyD family efflux transporter periplasmic adaptor subunit [Paucibacter sp. O1-1]|uniref:efflux RND transporter periplasmic adaptor subunit n=1 Tax=Paucibacter sp. M5-1 TaxID=3015998 RepID=UPI0010FA34BC|nr:HlyD family efflux transporter periplasmic adaptor subunit [Paucibacter sp. M5-1]MCU7371256.1 HlyD family efflux transporter periplasmic adaptor subunit [Paucibacter sp. O1-1]MCZ7883120.1 HlyD family efflux transporter periplasmic adaptor subunit [Paucibacter sp. M5-1]MDA3826245.1 HlyD family efflux transporter periplasmic adaptor subunit [Paucibacter sp. O1-1]
MKGLNLKSGLKVCALAAALSLGMTPAFAGEGHDHGDAPAATNSNGPQRLPDGSVFLPKPAQRQIGVRTLIGTEQSLPRGLELNGQVLMDPNAGGKVQAMAAGRLEPGPRGLPTVGQTVRKGEVLAYVLPSAGSLERANQQAQLAELRAARTLAEKRLARLRDLADTVPRKDIEALESEVASLGERVQAVGGGLSGREALVAPANGVIASAHAVAGQVIDARELVFEVVDPQRLRVEALAYDASVANDIAGAYVPVGSGKVALTFVGAARSLRDQVLPISFKAQGDGLNQLAVGQPVRVVVQTRSQVKGISVPAVALMKNPSNQQIVWIKTAPERFEPRVVMVAPLDGAAVAITAGLKAGERVVTDGAGLINQIR